MDMTPNAAHVTDGLAAPMAHKARRSLAVLATLATLVTALAATATLAQPAGPMREGGGPDMAHGPRHAMHPQGGGHGGPAGMRGMGPMMGGMLPERLLDQIGVTAEQKARLRELSTRAHADLRAQHDAERQLHQQMAELLTAPTLDAAAAEALRQKLQASHDATSKRRLQALLDTSAVLTPEQRQKLSSRMKQRHEMMERHHRERQGLEAPRS